MLFYKLFFDHEKMAIGLFEYGLLSFIERAFVLFLPIMALSSVSIILVKIKEYRLKKAEAFVEVSD
ncbi:hypothetical protein SAMN02910298_02776 [Pseudobutyrivibrio sp. YE44]|nr:hypothetical protein SAMN02910298_02776 [Pseudobutyrivibrio sp. YE44]